MRRYEGRFSPTSLQELLKPTGTSNQLIKPTPPTAVKRNHGDKKSNTQKPRKSIRNNRNILKKHKQIYGKIQYLETLYFYYRRGGVASRAQNVEKR